MKYNLGRRNFKSPPFPFQQILKYWQILLRNCFQGKKESETRTETQSEKLDVFAYQAKKLGDRSTTNLFKIQSTFFSTNHSFLLFYNNGLFYILGFEIFCQ